MNIDKLVKALEDEGNVNVIDTNKSSIKNNINNILQTLNRVSTSEKERIFNSPFNHLTPLITPTRM